MGIPSKMKTESSIPLTALGGLLLSLGVWMLRKQRETSI
jgi:LPXTG-motif cell wall-anchored protein